MKNTKKNKGQKNRYFVKPQSDEERFWTNRLKAVIYVRVSSEGQVSQWHGLESQESTCRDRCQKQPWLEIDVIKVFREEGVSWKYMNRKAMNEAIRFLEKENKKYTKIHYFVVTDADRIARPDDIAEAFTLEKSIEGLGVKIITVNNKRDMETDEWKFLLTIQYAVAGLERRKILRRTMNGKLSSLKNGWRPFPNPPLGYIREKFSDKGYQDSIDPIKWPIIKEGLELYACSLLFSKSQLHQFWMKKGLQTSKSKWKLYISFLEKTFRDYRLYYYAGYVYYPEWGIDVPIKWKHEALVSLEVIEKIMEKEIGKKPNSRSPNLDENLKIHPLKWLVTCYGCRRKLGCYASRWNGGIYYYYNCANKYCLDKTNVRKEVLESEFENLLEKMKLSQWVFDTFKSNFLNEWKEKKETQSQNLPQLQWQLLSIEDKMKKIENKVLAVTNEWLIKKLEEERSTLEAIYQEVKYQMTHHKKNDENFETTLSQAEYIFTQPLKLWKNSNYEIRQSLFMVWFGGVLYYKKNQWPRTNETTGLYYLFSSKLDANVHDLRKGGIFSNQVKLSKTFFEAVFAMFIGQSKYIQAIHKMNEIYWFNWEA